MILPDVDFTLDNGFRAMIVEQRRLPVVASTLWYRVGSRDERTGETGLSHFLEHMMFKGTPEFGKGEIDLITSKLGGSNNAFTGHDTTAYYFALASDRWEKALEIEASRMTGCLLEPQEFEAEKSVVLEELAMGEDDPWHQLYDAIESMTYQVHPYHHPVIGWRGDLEALGVDVMRSYYRRNYGPNRSFLVVAGDVDVDRTAARIRELFGSMEASADTRAPVLEEPPQKGERRAVVRFPGTEDIVRMAIGMRTCRMGERDDFVFDVLSHVLGSDKTGRLCKRLIHDEQVATHVWVSNEVRLDPGMMCIYLELRPGADPHVAEALVREELDRLQREGASDSELSRAKSQLRSAYLFEEETVLDIALRIGRFECSAVRGWGLLPDVLDTYESVSSEDLQAVCSRYFGPDLWNVATLYPEAGEEARQA